MLKIIIIFDIISKLRANARTLEFVNNTDSGTEEPKGISSDLIIAITVGIIVICFGIGFAFWCLCCGRTNRPKTVTENKLPVVAKQDSVAPTLPVLSTPPKVRTDDSDSSTKDNYKSVSKRSLSSDEKTIKSTKRKAEPYSPIKLEEQILRDLQSGKAEKEKDRNKDSDKSVKSSVILS